MKRRKSVFLVLSEDPQINHMVGTQYHSYLRCLFRKENGTKSRVVSTAKDHYETYEDSRGLLFKH